MAVWTWNPWEEMDRLRREVNRFLGDETPRSAPPYSMISFLPGRAARSYPLFNIHEDSEAFRVDALAPGLDPESINITSVNGKLTLAGEKTGMPKDIKPDQVHRTERAAGRFVREVNIPSQIDSDKISASYNNGLLQVYLPKKPEAQPRAIEVKVS